MFARDLAIRREQIYYKQRADNNALIIIYIRQIFGEIRKQMYRKHLMTVPQGFWPLATTLILHRTRFAAAPQTKDPSKT